ncbi:MAG: glucose 1-dehydrogenase [Mycobacteriaceae bacterium]|nr:glucose 1-dehydrogenase [Mycobacteriaceae bacterium]
MGRLDGKVALITGGARGMGKSHVRHFVAEGARVVFGDVLDDKGRYVADGLGAQACRYVHHDVTSEEDWAAAVATATEAFGGLDVLVNNAGVLRFASITDMPLAEFRQILDVNAVGCWLGMKSVIEPMKAAGGGSIINVSSIEGLRGAPWVHGYVASKWAVRGLTKSAALELAAQNIRVNSIHPGFIRTPMTKHLPEDMVTVPLGRPGEPIEVSTFVLFLASDESSYATGSEFVMDGGVVADVNRKSF